MIITLRRVVYINLTEVPTEDLLAEIQRRIHEAPAFSQPIPPPLRREYIK
jgi:hypothetical protein